MRLELDIGSKYPEITGPASDAFAADMKDACSRDSFTELVLDFKGTKMISSMAMGTLFAASQKLQEQGRSMRIINASPKVTTLLRMVNMDKLLMAGIS